MKTLKLLLILLLFVSPCFSQTTGGAGNANVWNFPGGFQNAGVTNLMHLYCTRGFADQSVTIALTTGAYFKVTNGTDDLYNTGINRGFTIQADSIQIPISGDYRICWDMSAANLQASDEIHFEIFVNNDGQSAKGESHNEVANTGTDVQGASTILNLTAGNWIKMHVKNVTAGNRDITVEAGNITIFGLFAN